MAIVYIGLGELDQALQSLETAANEGAWLTLFVKCDPRCEPLRSPPSPGYVDLLRRMQLAP